MDESRRQDLEGGGGMRYFGAHDLMQSIIADEVMTAHVDRFLILIGIVLNTWTGNW